MSDVDIPAPEAAPDWLPERLERARRAAVQDLLNALNMPDVEALRTALTSSHRGRANPHGTPRGTHGAC